MNRLAGNILPFLPEIVSHEMGNPSQLKEFELKDFMWVMQHRTVGNLESLNNGSRRFKWGFRNDAQNVGVNIVEAQLSGAMLVMEVFPSSANLPDRESNSSQGVSSPFEVRLKFCENLVCVKELIGEKSDYDPLNQFHREDSETDVNGL
jgi:hypothetical protein